jgi:proteic killer suppression protein
LQLFYNSILFNTPPNFDKEYLRELYEIGTATDKKHRFQPDIVARYQARIRTLERASRVEDLYTLGSLHYEKLKGDKEGLESVRVNDKYRIEFRTTQVVSETVVTVCNILELSNHYK